MSEQFILSIAPIVSLMVLVGIVGVYFLWKERREGEHPTTDKRN